MIKDGMKKAFTLRIISIAILAMAIVLRLLHGVRNSGMMIFAVVFGIIIYGIIAALSLFPTDWKTRAFEPATLEKNRSEIEAIEDKIQLKIAFGWVNIIVMLIVALGIYFGC